MSDFQAKLIEIHFLMEKLVKNFANESLSSKFCFFKAKLIGRNFINAKISRNHRKEKLTKINNPNEKIV